MKVLKRKFAVHVSVDKSQLVSDNTGIHERTRRKSQFLLWTNVSPDFTAHFLMMVLVDGNRHGDGYVTHCL